MWIQGGRSLGRQDHVATRSLLMYGYYKVAGPRDDGLPGFFTGKKGVAAGGKGGMLAVTACTCSATEQKKEKKM